MQPRAMAASALLRDYSLDSQARPTASLAGGWRQERRPPLIPEPRRLAAMRFGVRREPAPSPAKSQTYAPRQRNASGQHKQKRTRRVERLMSEGLAGRAHARVRR